MLEQYRTVRAPGSREVVIRKSRFIGHVMPVENEEEALQFIDTIKKQHWNATHNCSAYMIGERDEIQRQSDDGEPGGTAGKPILEVIRSQQVKNVAIVVTRYFGGIMLGAGGLIRAYTDGAVLALEAGEVITRVLRREVFVEIEYTWLGKVENALRGRNIQTGETLFTDKVTLLCLPRNDEGDAFIAWITDLTGGKPGLQKGGGFTTAKGNKRWQEEQWNRSCREREYWRRRGIFSSPKGTVPFRCAVLASTWGIATALYITISKRRLNYSTQSLSRISIMWPPC